MAGKVILRLYHILSKEFISCFCLDWVLCHAFLYFVRKARVTDDDDLFEFSSARLGGDPEDILLVTESGLGVLVSSDGMDWTDWTD